MQILHGPVITCLVNYFTSLYPAVQNTNALCTICELQQSGRLQQGTNNCPWSWASAHTGKWGQLTPLEKWMKKLKSENMQKRTVLYVCVILWEQSGQAGVENGAMQSIQNAPFRSQIFFDSGGKGALTPLTKILWTFLSVTYFRLIWASSEFCYGRN